MLNVIFRRKMSLATCQLPGQQYLKTCTAKVVSCTAISAPAAAEQSNKKQPKKGAAGDAAPTTASAAAVPKFNIVLSETVLFPEGGGQPFDTGLLSVVDPEQTTVKVLNVQREPAAQGSAILHQTDCELPAGTSVTVSVDWARRLDHMQQHSAQHLISAVFRRDLAAPTLSWSMSKYPESSYIEVDTDAAALTPEQFKAAETTVNDMIQAATPVRVHVYESAAAALEADSYKQAVAEGKAKAFPAGLVGPARCVEIEGVEFNTCCGTHVPELSHIGAVALIRYEKTKAGTRLWFSAGKRLTETFSALSAAQTAMTRLVTCPPEEHLATVERIMLASRDKSSEIDALRKRMIEMQLAAVAASADAVAYINEPAEVNGDSKTLSLLASTFALTPAAQSKVLVATAVQADAEPAAAGKAGVFVVCGADAAKVSKIGAAVAAHLEGRGGGRPGIFQGKVARVDKVGELPALIAAIAE
jgi:alanyl-tRNA synthetase